MKKSINAADHLKDDEPSDDGHYVQTKINKLERLLVERDIQIQRLSTGHRWVETHQNWNDSSQRLDDADDALQIELLEANKEITRLKEEMQRMHKVYRDRDQGTKWQELLKATTSQLKAARNENSRLQQELDEGAMVLNAWKQQIEDKGSQSKMSKLHVVSEKEMDENGREIERLTHMLMQNEKETKLLKEQISLKNKECEEYRHDLQSIVKTACGESANLNEDLLKTLRNDKDGVDVHIRALIAALKQKLETFESATQMKKEKVNVQRAKDTKWQELLKATTSQLRTARNENSRLQQELDQRPQALNALKENMREVEKENETQKPSLKEEQKEFSQRVSVMASFFNSLDATKEVELLNAENAAMKQEIADLIQEHESEMSQKNEEISKSEREINRMHELMKEMESSRSTKMLASNLNDESEKLNKERDRLRSSSKIDKKEIQRLNAVLKKSKMDFERRQKERERELMELKVREQGLAPLIALLRAEVDGMQRRFEDEDVDSNRNTVNDVVDGLKLRLSSLTWAQRLGRKRESWLSSSNGRKIEKLEEPPSPEPVAEELDNSTEIKAVTVDVVDIQQKIGALMTTVDAKNEEQQTLRALVSKLHDEMDRLKRKFPGDDDVENAEWEKTVGTKRKSWINAQKRKKKKDRKLSNIEEIDRPMVKTITECTIDLVDVQEKVDSLWKWIRDEMYGEEDRDHQMNELRQNLKAANLIIDRLKKESLFLQKDGSNFESQQSYTLSLSGDLVETSAFLKSEDVDLKQFGLDVIHWALGEQSGALQVTVDDVRGGSVLILFTMKKNSDSAVDVLHDAMQTMKTKMNDVYREPYSGSERIQWAMTSIEKTDLESGSKRHAIDRSLRKDIKAKDSELKQLKAKLLQNENKLISMKEQLATRDNEFDGYRASIESVFDRVSGDTEKIDFSTNRLLSLTAKEGEIRTLHIRVADNEQEIASLKRALKKKDEEIEVQIDSIRKMDDEMVSLRDTIREHDVEMFDLTQNMKMGNREKERLQSLMNQKNEISLKRQSEMKDLISTLRKEVDRLMSAFEEEEASTIRTELSWAQRLGLKRESWIHPDAAKRRQSRPLLIRNVPLGERAAAEQVADIQWIIADVIGVQQRVFALMDSKATLQQYPSKLSAAKNPTLRRLNEDEVAFHPIKEEKVQRKQKEIKQRVDGMTEVIESTADKTKNEDAEKERIQKQLIQTEVEIEKLKAIIDEMNAELQRDRLEFETQNENERSSHCSSVNSSDDELQRLSLELTQKRKDLNSLKQKVMEQNNSKGRDSTSSIVLNVITNESDARALKHEIVSAKDEMIELKKALNAKQVSEGTKQKMIHQLHFEMTQLEKEKTDVQRENDRLRQQMIDSEKDRGTQKPSLKEEQKELTQRMSVMASFFNSLDATKEVELLSAENAAMKQEIADLIQEHESEMSHKNEEISKSEREINRMHELMKEMEPSRSTKMLASNLNDESEKLKKERDRLRSRSKIDKKEIQRLKAALKKSKMDFERRQKERERELMELKVREQGLAPLIALLRAEVDGMQRRFEDEDVDSNRNTVSDIVDGLKLRLSSLTWAQRLGRKRESWLSSSNGRKIEKLEEPPSPEPVAEELDNSTEIKAVTVDVVDIQQKVFNLLNKTKDEVRSQDVKSLAFDAANERIIFELQQSVVAKDLRIKEAKNWIIDLQSIIQKLEDEIFNLRDALTAQHSFSDGLRRNVQALRITLNDQKALSMAKNLKFRRGTKRHALQFGGDFKDTSAFLQSHQVSLKRFAIEAIQWAIGQKNSEIRLNVDEICDGSVMIKFTMNAVADPDVLVEAEQEMKNKIGSFYQECFTGCNKKWILIDSVGESLDTSHRIKNAFSKAVTGLKAEIFGMQLSFSEPKMKERTNAFWSENVEMKKENFISSGELKLTMTEQEPGQKSNDYYIQVIEKLTSDVKNVHENIVTFLSVLDALMKKEPKSIDICPVTIETHADPRVELICTEVKDLQKSKNPNSGLQLLSSLIVLIFLIILWITNQMKIQEQESDYWTADVNIIEMLDHQDVNEQSRLEEVGVLQRKIEKLQDVNIRFATKNAEYRKEMELLRAAVESKDVEHHEQALLKMQEQLTQSLKELEFERSKLQKSNVNVDQMKQKNEKMEIEETITDSSSHDLDVGSLAFGILSAMMSTWLMRKMNKP